VTTADLREAVVAVAALEHTVMVQIERGGIEDDIAAACGMSVEALREAFRRWSENKPERTAPVRFMAMQIPAKMRGAVETAALERGLVPFELAQSILHAVLQTPHEPVPAGRIRATTRAKMLTNSRIVPTGKWERRKILIPMTHGLWMALCLRAKAIGTIPSKYIVGLLYDLVEGRLDAFTFTKTDVSDQFLFARQYMLPAPSSGSVSAQETNDG
jgi:hypothetical protein